MFLIPITGKISRHNLPVITITLIALNAAVFFLFQTGDSRRYMEAAELYFESDLAELEMPLYVELRQPAYVLEEAEDAPQNPAEMEQAIRYRLYGDMVIDTAFKTKLHAGMLITPRDPQYEAWRYQREDYEAALSRVVWLNHGFTPASPRPSTVFSYMFLHGGFMHLLGNMVFLWFLGCFLEMGFGRVLTGALYVIGGLAAVFLFWLFHMDSGIPLVGASGSIAGLMGAFAILYGMSRVKVFYSLGVYFDYVRFPALVLFPLWIGNEFLQLFFLGQQNVAYEAHIGGLLGGGVIGLGCRYLIGMQSAFSPGEEEEKDKAAPIIEDALERIGHMDFDGARRSLHEVLAMDPGRREALMHLFHLEKTNPESDAFHRAAGHLLHRLSGNPADHADAWSVYCQYRALAKPPRLSPELYLRLGKVFCGMGHVEAAEMIVGGLLKKRPDLAGLPAQLMRIANAWGRKDRGEKKRQCLLMLKKRYPETPEAALAEKVLASEDA